LSMSGTSLKLIEGRYERWFRMSPKLNIVGKGVPQIDSLGVA
jgi:hypothetical protein